MHSYILLLFVTSFLLACQPADKSVSSLRNFEKNYIQPTNGYAQMSVVTHDRVKTIYISGQVGEGKTLEAQMKSALASINELLKSEGAEYGDLVKMNTYIVDFQPEDLKTFRSVREEVFGSDITPASTLVGVQSLALPEWMIEIDGVAVLDSL